MQFLLGTFYFNQPMKKVLQFKNKMWSIDADVPPVTKQRFPTLSDGTLKNILNDKDSDNSMVM
jgi:hypothetical protein